MERNSFFNYGFNQNHSKMGAIKSPSRSGQTRVKLFPKGPFIYYVSKYRGLEMAIFAIFHSERYSYIGRGRRGSKKPKNVLT